uniref:Uncharacterized protein n=1 Tax=Anguilla anguilla TaxID=7936 RepID=A0A0E9RUW4_ANGAN
MSLSNLIKDNIDFQAQIPTDLCVPDYWRILRSFMQLCTHGI